MGTDISTQPPASSAQPASSPELTLSFDDPGYANELFGPQNATLEALSRRSGLRLASRGNTVTISGAAERAQLLQSMLLQLYTMLRSGIRLSPRDIELAYAMLEKNPGTNLQSLYTDAAFTSPLRKSVVPKTLNQRAYVALLREKDMTFATGPAGTGKSYLAVAVALSMLLSKKVRRIVLTRPAVEAGERLGFLPGDMAEKVNPYLRPLYDALHDMLAPEKVAEMIETGTIEIAPLAFMRGRTLNDAFIILDEAQNTTPEQMKMFVTRLGFGSRAAITGDVTQIDLSPAYNGAPRSGLVQALDILAGVEGIGFLHFDNDDVVRHPLVGRIVAAYDMQENSR